MHMSLDAGKELIADVYNFGFLTLDVISKDNVLTLCSPSGHVLVFTKIGLAFQLPLEVRDIFHKITDVKKDVVEKFLDNNGMDHMPLIDLHLVAKKNVEKISFGIQNFFKHNLAKTS